MASINKALSFIDIHFRKSSKVLKVEVLLSQCVFHRWRVDNQKAYGGYGEWDRDSQPCEEIFSLTTLDEYCRMTLPCLEPILGGFTINTRFKLIIWCRQLRELTQTEPCTLKAIRYCVWCLMLMVQWLSLRYLYEFLSWSTAELVFTLFFIWVSEVFFILDKL